MSDIKLVVGVDVEKSYDPFRTGVDALVKSINAKPPKVKVEFDLGDLNQFRKSIEDISKAVRNQNNSFKSAGVNAGQSFASGFNSSTSSIDFTGGLSTESVKGMKKLLNSFKIDNSSVQKITADLENLNLEIKKITTTSNGKSVKLNIIGSDIDSSGAQRTLSIVKEFNLETQKMSTLSTNVSHVFGNLTAGSQAQINILTQLKNLLTRINQHKSSWSAAAHGSTADEYKKYDVLASSVEGYIETVKSANITQDDAKRALAGFKAELSSIDGVIKNAGKNTQSFTSKIGSLAQKFGSWLSVSQLIMRFYQGFKKVVTSVKELDTAMTELKKVTDATNSEYNKFLDEATLRAKKLGATLTDTVSASADMARLGYDLKEAASLADSALVYKNVGDGISNIDEASSSLISTMQAFEVEATDSMQIVDKFNTAGNKFAISSGGVGDALLNSASALAAAGNTLDESIALVTAANEVVQNPAKVGTTLKTVSMFLRAAKTDAEAAGENTEGMAESVSKLRTEILQLTGGKVDIQLDKDTFKSTTQILRELSQVWDSLSDISQANILERIGGKRNSNVVAALLGNFDTVDRVISETSRSSGSAMAENEKYLDSIAGKMSQFSATFEDFSNSLLSSDLFKFIVDVGTKLLEISDNIVDITGALPLIASGVSAFFTFKDNNSIFRYLNNDADKLIDKLAFLNIPLRDFKIRGSKGRKSVNLSSFSDIDKEAFSAFEIYREGGILDADSITKLKSAFTGLSKEASDLIDNAAKSGKSIEDMAVSMSVADKNAKKLKLSTAALNAATGMLASIAVSLIFQGLSKLYDSVAHAAENSREELENLKAEYDDNASKLKDLNSELETTRFRMYELLNMGSLSYIEQEELNKLKQSNTELDREIGLLEQRNKLLKEQKELKFVETVEKGFDSYFGAREGLSGFDWFSNLGIGTTRKDIIRDKADDYTHNQNMYEHFRGLYLTEENKSLQDKHKEAMDRAKKWLDDDLSYLSTQALEIESIISGIEYGSNSAVNSSLDMMNDMLDTIYISLGTEGAEDTAFSRLINQTYDEVTDKYEELGKEGKVTAKILEDAYSNDDSFASFIDNLVEIGYISGTTKSDLAQVARTFNALGEEATNSADSVEDAFQRWEDAQNAVQSGAQFDKALEAFNHVYDTVADKKSDLYGRIGNEDYKAAIELVIPDSAGIDISNPDAVKKYLSDNLKKYFVFDEDGNYAGANLTKFFKDSEKAGLMEYIKETDSWVVKGQQSLETWAEELNMTVPVVKAIFGEANEFGGNFQFYELDDDLVTLATNAKNAKDSLEETFGEKYSLKLDVSEIEDKDEKINVLNETIDEAQTIINTKGVDPAVANNARKVLEFALKQKQELEKPAVMYVDTTQIDDEKIASAIQKVQKYIETKNQIELYTELGQPTPESVQKAYDSAIKALQNSEFLASIGFKIDEKSDKSIDEQIDEFIDKNLTKDRLTLEFALGGKFGLSDDIFQPALDAVETLARKIDEIFNGDRKLTFNAQLTHNGLELTVNTEDIERAQGEAEQFNEDLGNLEDERNADVGTTKETKKSFNLLKEVERVLQWLNGYTFSTNVNVDINTDNGKSEANGTAHANGSTPLPQPVTNAIGGKVSDMLGGNLGKYLPASSGVNGTAHANGNWAFEGGEALVGELGQELVVNPATSSWYTVGDHGAEFVDIPRNAIIFNHKQTESLLKNGYVTGRGRALAGGTALESEGSITGSMTTSDANRSSVSGGKSTTQKSSSKDNSTQTIDYIEILLERLSRALERFASIADDTSKSFSARNKAIENEIKKTDELIKANEKAASVYLKEANSVKLSSSLKKKVREGDYDISDYNSDTAELINKYKELYDKYLNAADEAANQKTNKAALQMERFELTQQKYDSKFELQDAKVDYYENLDAKAELEGKGGSVNAQEKMISVYDRRHELLKKERAELEAMFNSGTIQKGTEAWYEMKTAIQENKSELIATENEIAELNNRINEIQYERFNNIADSYENRISLKDNRISYHEALNKQAELEGKGGSVNAQETIISLNQDRVELLEEEREKLRAQLKNIDKGSKEWYEAKQKVQDINVDLVETENAILEGKKNIENINWENFEKISTSYDGLHNAYDAKIAYYEDSNTKHQLNGNQGSLYAQDKMAYWENQHILDYDTELEELYAERDKYDRLDPNYDKMTERIREVKDLKRNSENKLLEYRNNKLDILSSRFQDIESLYDSKMSNIDHKVNTLTNEMSALELQGYKVSAEYYEKQKKIEQDRISVIQRGINERQAAFDKAMETGEIKKYSQEWYDYQLGVNKANEELQEANNKLLEIDKTIRDLDFENFEYLRDTVAQLNDESDFYINLMSDEDLYDEKGNLTDDGIATLGLHGQNYNVYMNEAEEYGKELADVKKKLADDPNNIELIDRERELAKAQRDCIIAAQDEKMAMRDLVEDGINYQLDALQKLIDEYSEALDKAKDLHDYEKKVADHTSEISSLRKQISAYSGDDSQEAKLKVQQLQTDLKEAEENLEETEYDRYISDQKDLLDEFYSNYEEILVAELDDIDTLIKGVVETINTNSGSINETLNGLSDKFGVSLSEHMRSIWGDETLDTVLSSYIGDDESGVLGKQTTINKTLDEIELDVERILNANMPKIDDEKQNVPIVEVSSSNNNTSNSDTRVETSTDKPEIDININDTTPNSNETPDTTNGTTNAALESLFGGVFSTLGDIFGSGATNATETEGENHELLRVGSIIDVTNSQPYGDKNGNKQIINMATRNGLPTEYVVDRIEGNYILAVNTQDSRYKYWFKDTDVDIKKYKNGGLVDYTGLAWVDGTKENPEYMLNAEDTAYFLKLKEDIKKLYSSGVMSGAMPISTSGSDIFNGVTKTLSEINHSLVSKDTNIGDINITIPIEKVQDYNDFVMQLKDDPKFDKFLKATTIDLLDGKSRLAKNRINWNK